MCKKNDKMLKFTYLFFASGRSFLIHLKGGICGIRKTRLLFLVKIVANSNGSTVCMSCSVVCMSSKSYAKFLEKNNRIDLCDYHSFCVFGGIYLRNKGTKLNKYVLRKYLLEKRHAKFFSFNVQ